MKIPRECRLCLGREICGLGCLSRGNEMCRDFHNAIESKITVRRKPPVQQRKGAIIPLCVDRKTCSAFVKGPCGGTSSERQDHFGCYRESDTAPVA